MSNKIYIFFSKLFRVLLFEGVFMGALTICAIGSLRISIS